MQCNEQQVVQAFKMIDCTLEKLFDTYRIPRNLDKTTTITIQDQTFEVRADDLEVISELGRGAYGVVEKRRHRPTDTIMAVKVS